MYLVIFIYETSTTDIILYDDIPGIEEPGFDLEKWVESVYGSVDDGIAYFVSDYLNIEI